jgi:hypothetical protein
VAQDDSIVQLKSLAANVEVPKPQELLPIKEKVKEPKPEKRESAFSSISRRLGNRSKSAANLDVKTLFTDEDSKKEGTYNNAIRSNYLDTRHASVSTPSKKSSSIPKLNLTALKNYKAEDNRPESASEDERPDSKSKHKVRNFPFLFHL